MAEKELYNKRPPRKTKDTSLLELLNSVEHKIGFTRDMLSFARLPGGLEFNLIKCIDAKIRLVVASVQDIDETTVHAFIHVAKKIENINESHVAALVDNRKRAPICLIQNCDGENKVTAWRVFRNFFSTGGAKVRITDMYVLTKVHILDS